jgi:4-amino-4-deoxy-L-arabinose transferase-like glycosyltransferase
MRAVKLEPEAQDHSMKPVARLRVLAPPIAIALVFLAMLAVSWRRWTSPIADSGREMDLPPRLMNGEMLYRDVHYLYPPLSPYFNALLYRLFGSHLDALMLSGIICAALVVALCYRIARRLLSPVEASVATVGIIIWCVFKPAGNLISPYSFAALHGMMLALATLLFSLRYAEGVQSSAFRLRLNLDLILAGASIGLAAITKQEFALAGAATVMATILFLHWRRWKAAITSLLVAAVPAMLIALPVYAWLFKTAGYETLVEDCHLFYTHLPASLVFYNSHRTGLDRPLFSLAQMLGAAAVSTAAASAIVLFSDRTRKLLRPALVIFACALLSVFVIKLVTGKYWDGSPLRALPLMLLGILVRSLVRSPAFRRNGSRSRPIPPEGGTTNETTNVFIIAAYSLAILARVALRVPSGGAFGGFFLPTSLIVIFYLLVCVLPYWIDRWTSDEVSADRARRIGQGLFILMLVATAVVFSVRYRKNFTYEIEAARGHLFVPRASGPAIEEALQFIELETQPGEAIAVLPEGSDLAFLSNRAMPLRHQILIPGLMREQDELAAIATLRRVRYVLIVNRPMREFGKEAFGRDFYTRLGESLAREYQLIKICGAAEPTAEIGAPRFFIKVLKRRE